MTDREREKERKRERERERERETEATCEFARRSREQVCSALRVFVMSFKEVMHMRWLSLY